MSAVRALRAAYAAGVQLGIDGDALLLEAAAAPPAAVLDLLARHKAGVIALLRSGGDGWSSEDWQAFYDERAGIEEFDGGLPRSEAEDHAFDRCVVEWLNLNPARSAPGRCLGCGNDHREPVVPFGIDPAGRAWLHPHCWPAWHAGRCAEAVAALRSMGIFRADAGQ